MHLGYGRFVGSFFGVGGGACAASCIPSSIPMMASSRASVCSLSSPARLPATRAVSFVLARRCKMANNKLTFVCVGRGIPERNVARVGGSAESGRGNGSVRGRTSGWRRLLCAMQQTSHPVHTHCGEPKPAFAGSWMTHVTTPVARLSRKLPDGTSTFSRLHRVLVWVRTEASASAEQQASVVAQGSPSSFSRRTCRCSGKKSGLRRSSSDI